MKQKKESYVDEDVKKINNFLVHDAIQAQNILQQFCLSIHPSCTYQLYYHHSSFLIS